MSEEALPLEPVAPQPVTLARSTWWDMPVAPGAARQHRIFLAWPEAPPPPGGYPVLLVLDANSGFATAVEAYRALRYRTIGAGPVPSLILGLGHPGEAPYDAAARGHDYVPSLAGAASEGGGEAFLDFIEGALLPELERRHPVDRARLALFGHSLGGLFTLHAMFSRPGLFRGIVAASPSLWWGDGVVLEAARRFAANPPAGADRIRLLVTVGALEESDAGPRGAVRLARRMIGNARSLAALLREAGLSVAFTEFADEDHGSARTPALARAPRFALPRTGDPA